MSVSAATYLCLFAPLVGTVLLALLGNRIPAVAAGWLGSFAALASFVGAVAAWAAHGSSDDGVLLSPYTWLEGGDFRVGFDLFVDALSIFEMLVVSGVGTLIVIYSIGYMHGDAQERRFFAYMNLFIFAMLMLVTAGNLVLLLVGWGLVGMASYLLIGFWHDRPTAVAAAKKAFVMNVVGDVGIMLALFMIFVRTTALDYPTVFERLPGTIDPGGWEIAVICLLLLAGALAKSAQLPLHTWLPDAMEGPTPVSALIHAATMVTAGVYLVARMGTGIFALSPTVHDLIAVVGAAGLLFAGAVALTQTDIKRVIAYSTMSQIGYMFVAAGVGAYSAAMFHLMTHAFFKALLFLAAGIVIHALAGEQDIRRMGGLRSRMPVTYWLFVVASLALAGIVPLSGFFSKDEILASAFHSGGVGAVVWGMGMLGVLLTAIYSMRLLLRVFHGEAGPATLAYAGSSHVHARDDAAEQPGTELHSHDHHHGEAPRTMLWPVLVLGVLTVVGGWLWIPGLTHVPSSYLGPAVDEHVGHASTGQAWLLACLSLLGAGLGIAIAWRIWGTGVWSGWTARAPRARSFSEHAFGFDAAYDFLFHRPAARTAEFVSRWIEAPLVARSIDGVVRVFRGAGDVVSWSQAGVVRVYAVGTALGATAFVAWMLAGQG